jgi:hypothetical protein
LRVERHTARDDGLLTASFLPEMELPTRPFAATGWTETAARAAIVARALGVHGFGGEYWCGSTGANLIPQITGDEDLERVDEAHRQGAM